MAMTTAFSVHEPSLLKPDPVPGSTQQQQQQQSGAQAPPPPLPPLPLPPLQDDGDGDGDGQLSHSSLAEFGLGPMSFSDIVARDAARSCVIPTYLSVRLLLCRCERSSRLTPAHRSNSFSQTLGSLGFAPDETLNDFLAISYNPDPVADSADADPLLGSEMDQRTYYELLMGRQFT